MRHHFVIYMSILLTLGLAACGGGGGGTTAATETETEAVIVVAAPLISSFVAASSTINIGDSVNLTAIFTNGTASINNSVGSVTSNVAKSVSPKSTTTYTVTVTNTADVAVTSTITVTIDGTFSIAKLRDPLALQQWHLKNTGQTAYADSGGVVGMDVNVDSVYGSSYDGDGVLVAVVDSGLEIAHEDLASNVVVNGSWNFSNSSTDPTSNSTSGDHGTSVAGLIAMARNTIGGMGVAPAAQLKGFNFLSGSQSIANNVDSLGGSSISPKSDDVFVFNQSYGFNNAFDFLANSTVLSQYVSGVTSLRSGKGALYVKSSGNGFSSFGSASCSTANTSGLSCQNASFDPYNSIPYQVVVGATNANGIKSSYSTAGSAIWISAPGGEFGNNASVNPGSGSNSYAPAMVTTDQSNCTVGYARTNSNRSAFNNGTAPNTDCNYANTFNGTSSAAPVTVGVIALILEANSLLTWRDVKHILATTARQIDDSRAAVNVTLSNGSYTSEPAWTTNAAGFNFHNWYGFGMINAAAAVNMATNSYSLLDDFDATAVISSGTISLAIPENSVTGVSSILTVSGTPSLVEAVQITVSATHTASGDLAIELTSPSGTKSVLKNGRDGFGSSDNLSNMVLISNAFYGETLAGDWRIKLVDTDDIDTGTLTNWTIKVYGR